ncbi:unnamed protein product, partial [Allacma fusca]
MLLCTALRILGPIRERCFGGVDCLEWLREEIGIVRHYVAMLLSTQKKVELLQVQDSQAMIRARMLRENGKYLPEQSFLMRRSFFNDEDTGYFKTQKRTAAPQNPMSDPSMMTEMLKGNVTNVLPMILIGGWINWTFSGFVTTKVPFP